jgi:hypothetical protein
MSTGLAQLLSGMSPRLLAGAFVYVDDPAAHARARALVWEAEGVSCVVEQGVADEHGWVYGPVLSWITLEINSDLADVGLTAAVSTALAEAGIACNVLAGLRHDHLLVPAADAARGLQALLDLSATSS